MPLCAGRIGFVWGPGSSVTKGTPKVKASHARPVRRAVFDEPNLLAAAGLVPVVALADRVGIQELADRFLTVPTFMRRLILTPTPTRPWSSARRPIRGPAASVIGPN